MTVTGLESLQRTLRQLADACQQKATRAALAAANTAIAARIRSGVNASAASTEVKREARKLIGKLVKKRGGQFTAKAGFAVGQKGRKKQQAKSKGFVSPASIHLFVMGTDERATAGGHATGRIRGLLAGIVQSATSAASGAAASAAGAAARKAIEREAKRLASGIVRGGGGNLPAGWKF